MMAFSLGFCKLTVEQCEKEPSILKKYFKEYAECPEYVVQDSLTQSSKEWSVTQCVPFRSVSTASPGIGKLEFSGSTVSSCALAQEASAKLLVVAGRCCRYAIANKAAVSTEDGTEHIVTGDDIPEEFLENAKRIGKEALKAQPLAPCLHCFVQGLTTVDHAFRYTH